jgi:rhodanese-related sulfurtransferase
VTTGRRHEQEEAVMEDLTPEAVADLLAQDAILLVDVREPHEHDAERIEGAHLAPLSCLDPSALPDPGGRLIVFHCALGGRSAKAMAIAQAAGLPVLGHVAGGIQAWKSAGLAVK